MKIWQLTEATIEDIKKKVQRALVTVSNNNPTVSTDAPTMGNNTTTVGSSGAPSNTGSDTRPDTSSPKRPSMDAGGDKGVQVDTSTVKVQDQKFHASGKYYIKKINGRNFIIDPQGQVTTGVFGNAGGFSDAKIPEAEKAIERLNQGPGVSDAAPVTVASTAETADSIKSWASGAGISGDSNGAPGQILNKIRAYMKGGKPIRAIMLVQRNAKIVTDKYYKPGEKDAIMKAAEAQKSKLGL